MCSSAKSPSPELIETFEAIRNGRESVSFSEYLQLALYHPQFGYYAQGTRSVGKGGDFYTNVSVGPVFAEIVLEQIAEMWRLLDRPEPFHVVEQGAHHGQFANDFLNLATTHPELAEALRYAIVEPHPALATHQRTMLSAHSDKVEWHSDFTNLKIENGVHWSNELIDALPFELIEWNGERWLERRVAVESDHFVFRTSEITSADLRSAVAALPTPTEAGYQTEIRLSHRAWLDDVSRSLQRGFVLLCDYGYPRDTFYQPSRREGTLFCYEQHRRSTNPLESPGQKDISAHVDFSSLASDAEARRLKLIGFTDQHHFVVGAAETLLRSREGRIHTDAEKRWLKTFKTLLHPELMGTQFKFMALAKGHAPTLPLAGFRFQSPLRAALGLISAD